MLGYIKPYKPELKIKEYELYRGVYCSLCKALGRNYTPAARLLLSYDFALAAMIRLGLAEDPCIFDSERCPFNLTKKCNICRNDTVFDFCAHCIVIIAYYKVIDNIRDRGFFKTLLSLVLFPVIYLMHIKAAKRAPEIEKTVKECMKNQADAENNPECTADEAAHFSAEATGRILAFGFGGETAGKLESLGYMLGRFVYLIDAADDLEDDIKKKNFNPFKSEFPSLSEEKERADFALRAEHALNLTQGRLLEIKETIEFRRFGVIIDNILLDGLDKSEKSVIEKYRASAEKPVKTFTVK